MERLKSVLVVLLCMSILVGFIPIRDVQAAGSIAIPDMYQSMPVKNPGFEEPSSGGVIPGWPSIPANSSSVTAKIYPGMSNSGDNSFMLKDDTITSNVIVAGDKIKVEAGQTYEYTAKVYIVSGTLKLYMQFLNSAGVQTGNYSVSASAAGKWNALAVTKIAPANSDYVILKFGCDKAATGEGYYDDISLNRIINSVNGLIENSSFERTLLEDNTIPGWNITSGNISDFELSGETADGSGNSLKIISNDSGLSAVESYPIGVAFDETYNVSGSVYYQNENSAAIELRFYNRAGLLISSLPVSPADSDKGKWTKLSVKDTVPSDAAYATIALLSASAAYFDDIAISKVNAVPVGTLTNLGTQVPRAVVPTGAIVINANGDPLACVSINGDPGKLAVVNMKTSQIVDLLDLGVSEQSWGMMADADNSVYIGSVKIGRLYRYVPGSSQLEDLGVPVSGETNIYGLVRVSDDIIYGATYPNGKLFEYNTTTKVYRDLGTVVEGEAYARAIDYDPAENAIYVGTGAHCKIIRYDIVTGQKTSLLSDSYSTDEYPNHIDVIGNKLFVALNKSSSIIVMDKTTGEVEYTIPKATKRVVETPDGTKAYVFSENSLSYYDLNTKTLVPVLDLEGNYSARTMKFVDLNQAEYPGQTLVAWLGNNIVFKYNLETGKYSKDEIPLPGQPTDIRTIFKGPDGKIYSGGYMGGLASYDPITDKTVYLGGVSQPEGITSYGNTLYLGVYPTARIMKYDTDLPFNSSLGNPALIYQIPQDYLQDRPFGMAVAEELGKLFIGTTAQYGHMQGSFSVYDLPTGDCQTYTDVVYNQSIVDLKYKNGKVYGGTSIWGALGADESLLQKEAKFFVWDVAAGKKELEIVPVPGARMISGLIEGPDGKIWGVAEGYLFIFDPETKSVVYTKQIAPISYGGIILKDANMSIGTDGNVYGTTYRYFFKVDAVTRKITILNKTGNFEYLVQDDFGNFYFRPSDKKGDLWKYTDESLIVKLTAAELSVSSSNISLGGTEKVSIKGILEKGRTTVGLERGDVQYTYSNPGIVTIENGVIKPVSLGETTITATVTVNGVTAQTNEITVKVLDNNALLGDIKVYNQSIAEFNPDVNEYTVELPYEMPVPEVAASAQSTAASVNIIPAAGIPGTTVIEVTAENGITKNIYKINFTVAPEPENNKDVKAILKEFKELREVMKKYMEVQDAMKIYQDVKAGLKEYEAAKPEDKADRLENVREIIKQSIDKAKNS